MVYPDQSPEREDAEAVHPRLKNTHLKERAVVLGERRVARRLSWEVVIALVVVVAAIALLYLL
jgi:hypothetical protein